MDIYTKIFLINLALIVSMVLFDATILNDYIVKNKWIAPIAGTWVVLTAASILVWPIYLAAVHL